MARIPHSYFDWDDSILDFLAQLRLDLQNRGIDPAGAGANRRAQALGHLRACMRGRTLEWFDEEITTKTNWELTNLTDGTGQANLVAVNGRTALQIGADGLNEAARQPGNAIIKLRAVEDPWNKDWRVAGG
ncbi:9976_t:CDS:1, partial [Funneliformis geosporum]